MAYTPMIEQYLKIKANYQDAFLFFRLGDFYEMFFDDALNASKVLEITLTSREGGTEERIPMCGVPYHAAKQYIKVLIEKGYKIAICEQLEDAKQTKGMVKRDVVQVITPGTVMEDVSLSPKSNNYLTAIHDTGTGEYTLAASDLTTGEIRVVSLPDITEVRLELASYEARELVVESSFDQSLLDQITSQLDILTSVHEYVEVPSDLSYVYEVLQDLEEQAGVKLLLSYLSKTQQRSLDHLQKADRYEREEYMSIDPRSRRHLELIQSLRDKKTHGTLLWLLDETKTAMGGRLLKQWIEKPLIQETIINQRLDKVAAFIDHFFERNAIRDALSHVYDLERLVGRVSFGNVNARELNQLKGTLQQLPAILAALSEMSGTPLGDMSKRVDNCEDIAALIEKSILPDPPPSITDGNIIKDGYQEQLDNYRHISKNGKSWIAELERKEREFTGIKSLKVGYNKVFGYFIEVTKANLRALPEGRYERKQTLSNAERFITDELKEKESLILEAEDKMVDLEYHLFQEIRLTVKEEKTRLQKLARQLAVLDVLQSLAVVSETRQYIRPVFNQNQHLNLKENRHPVVEKVLGNQTFVANDVQMATDTTVLLITGPNMGGKSTYMRQLALTAIMAQIGCFVPANEAELPIYDQIFTRIGASDDLVSGQSTFMVEMLETQHALTHATEKSLILLDEIGRGTSTYDGIALAQSIVEYIHDQLHAKTLFSTHYHELTALSESLNSLKNIHVGAVEEEGKVVFLHKVLEGPADRSYGIHVADLAELPKSLIERAQVILKGLETGKPKVTVQSQESPASIKSEENENEQLAFFDGAAQVSKAPALTKKEKEVMNKLESLSIMEMTPMEAMNVLYDLHKRLRKHTERVR